MKNTPRYKAAYVLWEKQGGWRQFDTFEELKTFLIENTDKLFGWINNHVANYNDYRELPNFIDVKTVRDINDILDDYNYGWWFIKVDTTFVEDENEIE